LELKPAFLTADDAPQEILSAAKPYEVRFNVKFTGYFVFNANLMKRLHNHTLEIPLPPACIIASKVDHKILSLIGELTEIANILQPTYDQRTRYFQSLISLYQSLPKSTESFKKPETLHVCPEREGRILAFSLGWFGGRCQTPHAKRIPYRRGLIVGLSGLYQDRAYESCNIIDGAIASGATLISIMEALKRKVVSFHVYSAHAAIEGLRALFVYACANRIALQVTVAHATEGLNKKYYAVVEGSTRLVVGDLGDTIADLTTEGGMSNVRFYRQGVCGTYG